MNPQRTLKERLEKAAGELWVVVSLLFISALLNFLLDSQRVVLGFYTLPTIASAYFYGRRHATLTAFASVLLVVFLATANTQFLSKTDEILIPGRKWLDIAAWGGILVLTGYVMGGLYEHKVRQLKDLRETYYGVLLILRSFISNDQYTENHSYRVSIYASKIATCLRLDAERIEDVRAAALLHDIGKLAISRSLLYKAARLSEEEYEEVQQHVDKGGAMLEPVGGSLRRIIPIILAHHEKYDGNGYHQIAGEGIPLESRIIALADVYDSLTSDRPYRKAMSPYEVKEIIANGSGKDFDPRVVTGFLDAFRRRELEIPQMAL